MRNKSNESLHPGNEKESGIEEKIIHSSLPKYDELPPWQQASLDMEHEFFESLRRNNYYEN